MSRLEWGKAGARLFESGIDRGALYPRYGTPVPWIGLTGLEENFGQDASNPVYFDGVKIRDDETVGDFVGTLSAFTYPDEFAALEGMRMLAPGFYADDQQGGYFDLSFRTRIGNDIEGEDYAYKLHIIHNLVVTPAQRGRETHTEEIAPTSFQWEISATPSLFPGFRPTSHVIFDSTRLDPFLMATVEDTLYGDDDTDPRMMNATELYNLATIGPYKVTDIGDGTVSISTTYDDVMQDLGDGLYQLNYINLTPTGDPTMFTIHTT